MLKMRGEVQNFDPTRRFGRILVEKNGQFERFWFYQQDIDEGTARPVPGQLVDFVVFPERFVAPGRLPVAHRLIIHDVDAHTGRDVRNAVQAGVGETLSKEHK